MTELRKKFRTNLEKLFIETGFEIMESDSGIIAKKEYELGEKIIFFEIINRGNYLKVNISVWLTDLPVQKIHSLINEINAKKAIISLRLSFLAKKMNKKDANFERLKFNGALGSTVSEESMSIYISNLEKCLKELIFPFFSLFTNQHSIDSWLNKPILENKYDYEKEPVWKDAINSLIVAKLVNNKNFEQIFNKWMSIDLPFNTKNEIEKLRDILENEIELL